MHLSCPHCRELVSVDPQAVPTADRCPRCGGDLPAVEGQEDASNRSTGAPEIVQAHENAETGAAQALEASADTEPAEADAPVTPLTTGGAAPSLASLLQSRQAAEGQTPRPGDGTELGDAGSLAAAADDPAAAPKEAIATADEPGAEGPTEFPIEQWLRNDEARADEPEPGSAAAPTVEAAANPSAGVDTALTSPSFIHGTKLVHRRAPAWQWLAIVALGLLLLVQVLLADRARLASDPRWRPVVGALCGMLGCSLPSWREPSAFTMLSRDVRPLPGVPGALQAQATFRNEARWPQAWPVLVLSLSDADGRVLGARAFSPGEYLADPAQPELAPGQSAQVMLRLREPDPGVVAFAFDFR